MPVELGVPVCELLGVDVCVEEGVPVCVCELLGVAVCVDEGVPVCVLEGVPVWELVADCDDDGDCVGVQEPAEAKPQLTQLLHPWLGPIVRQQLQVG